MDDGFRNFLAEYGYQGDRWSLTIPAKSWEEARERLKAISMGQIIGSDVVTIRVPFGGLLIRLWRRLFG